MENKYDDIVPVSEIGDYRYYSYVDDIISRKIPSCDWVYYACQRFLNDLDREEDEDFPYYFDESLANLAVDFFPVFLRHHQGEWTGDPLYLEPWEQFIIANIYGWKRKSDNIRRFLTAYVSVGRKNGKTAIAGGIGLKGMVADAEEGARIVCAATKRKQARLVWDSVVLTLEQNPELMREANIKINKGENTTKIYQPGTASDFVPLGQDSNTEDGHNIHVGIIDEYHEHPNSNMKGVIQHGMSARRQPLLFTITTAGFDTRSPAYQEERYIKSLLDGTVENDRYFAIIYTLDDNDDWRDSNNWIKSNPNLGVSKKFENMENLALGAETKGDDKNQFLTKDLNVWTQATATWIDSKLFFDNNNGEVNEDELEGRVCYGGLDYASTIDYTWLTWVFPPVKEGERWKYLHRVWVPGDLLEKSRTDRAPYPQWKTAEIIFDTQNGTIDASFVERQIREDYEKFSVQELAYDKYGEAKLIAQNLEKDGLPTVDFPQGIRHMSPAAKEWARMISNKEQEHGKHPVIDLCVKNTHVYVDANDNIKPMKEKKGDPTRHIDGVISSIMATWRAKVNDGDNDNGVSVYEDRGILSI